MERVHDKAARAVLFRMVEAIQENKAYLGSIDGLIGDGDHGANMAKGFTAFGKHYAAEAGGFCEGLDELGSILLNDIGGSMGPIYGTMFMSMAQAAKGAADIDLPLLARMLEAGLTGLYDIVDARVGDKTLIDTLAPAAAALNASVSAHSSFAEGLLEMERAAAAGRDATRDMVARFGRASRLGERSRGVLDAGAASCCVLLTALSEGLLALLREEEGL